MDTLADVIATAREHEGDAFDAPDRQTGYSFAEFCTNCWKAGNLLRHYGVREGARVAVVVGPKDPGPDAEPGYLAETPDPLLAAFGATLLGAVVDPQPGASVDATALVAPAAWLDGYKTGPGTSVLAYGGPPEDPDVGHFERQLWSENPVAPPETVDSETLAVGDGSDLTHGELVTRARDLGETHGLGSGDRVAVRGRIDADVLIAGVIAPLVAGATMVGGPGATGDVQVGAGGEIG